MRDRLSGRRDQLQQPARTFQADVRVQLAGGHLDRALQEPALRIHQGGDVTPRQLVEVAVRDAQQGDEPTAGRGFAEEHRMLATHGTTVDGH